MVDDSDTAVPERQKLAVLRLATHGMLQQSKTRLK
jgi:hypothetical protein